MEADAQPGPAGRGSEAFRLVQRESMASPAHQVKPFAEVSDPDRMWSHTGFDSNVVDTTDPCETQLAISFDYRNGNWVSQTTLEDDWVRTCIELQHANGDRAWILPLLAPKTISGTVEIVQTTACNDFQKSKLDQRGAESSSALRRAACCLIAARISC